MNVPMSEPDITAAERAAVAAVLETPTLALGPHLARFEERIAAYTHTAHAVGVSSGTAGLHLGVLAAGVEPGDLVITSPFSFIASANCILYAGGRPVFVDVDPVSLTIDPDAVLRYLTRLERSGHRARVKALLPVHVFGHAAEMGPLLAIAERHGLAVIEDACEAIGAEYEGRPVGSLGQVGVFAFYPNKQMTTGEGGMIVTDDAAHAMLFRSLRNQGRDVFDGWLTHSRLGYNYRLSELAAALGEAQVARLDEILARRERVAAWYGARLADVDGLDLPGRTAWATRLSWFVYVVRLHEPDRRDQVIHALERRGIPSRPYFPPIHLQPFYRERFRHRPGEFPVAEAAGASCLALPFFTSMREAQVDEVCGALVEVLGEAPAARRAIG